MIDEEIIKYDQRMFEFCEPIRRIGLHNPTVMAIMEVYARSQILTMNEALSRIVVELSRCEENANERLRGFMQNSARPIFIPDGFRLVGDVDKFPQNH